MVPINFIVPAKNDKVLEYLKSIELDDSPSVFDHSTKNWTLQSFCILNAKMEDVRCNRYPLQGMINIGHAQYLRTIRPDPSCFYISITGEYRHLLWAHSHIVQNKSQHNGKKYHYITHWGQPGLIPRSEGRRNVKNVAFAGRPTQLSARDGYIRSKLARFGYFTSINDGIRSWTDEMSKIGMQFVFLGKPKWNDMMNIDILIGIRSYDRERYNYLPPTKLLNAWHAGIPFIGGSDSAYEQVGTPGVDYIRVDNHQEAIDAIQRLRDDRQYYNSIVSAGRHKSVKYTRNNIASEWIKLLDGPIRELYDNWSKRNNRRNRTKYAISYGFEKIIRYAGQVTLKV
jgi:hypothetical protein